MAEESEKPREKISRRRLLIAATATAAGIAGAATLVKKAPVLRRELFLADRLVSHHRPGNLPETEPLSPLWKRIAAFEVTMLAQTITLPHLTEAGIANLLVRSLNNGRRIAFHLEWTDATEDSLERIELFRDAAAVQLAVDPERSPAVTMGAPGNPVHVLQWKASWQRDVDRGFQDMKAIYPNWFNDVYPGHESLKRAGLTDETARGFYPGLAAGNPLSQPARRSPVEELTAEGFGTLTAHAEQKAAGRGVYRNARWAVTIAIPMRNPAGKASLRAGEKAQVAFAVWDGARKNAGGRKQWSNWVTIEIEGG